MSIISNAGAPTGSAGFPLRISTAGYDVIASGTVITGDNKNLEFHLAHLKVVFSFQSDGGVAGIKASVSATSELRLILSNFNNAIGSGTTTPIEIGTFSGRKLLLSFMVYAMSQESSKTVHYTFMLGEPE